MTRWRPPAETSAPYITPEGYAALQDEYAALWKRRVDVTAAVTAAAAEGDRSENAEYIYRKKELRGIDRRIGYLKRRMPALTIVRQVGDTNKVLFGAWVSLLDEADQSRRYRVVGADEIGRADYISVDSPLARALLKKQCGDEVELRLGDTLLVYEVVGIDYASP